MFYEKTVTKTIRDFSTEELVAELKRRIEDGKAAQKAIKESEE